MFRDRWRTWARKHTPDMLYKRGVVIPKVKDCRDHDWYVSTPDLEACYHCHVTRESADSLAQGPALNWISHDLGRSLVDLEDKDAVWATLDESPRVPDPSG